MNDVDARGPLDLEAPATVTNASLLRSQFQHWHTAAAPDQDGTELVLAVYEALANAVEHAYTGHPDPPGPIRLRAHHTDNELIITVADNGTWRHQPSTTDGHRGRGLPLMRELTSHTHIEHTPGGTTVTLRTTTHQ